MIRYLSSSPPPSCLLFSKWNIASLRRAFLVNLSFRREFLGVRVVWAARNAVGYRHLPSGLCRPPPVTPGPLGGVITPWTPIGLLSYHLPLHQVFVFSSLRSVFIQLQFLKTPTCWTFSCSFCSILPAARVVSCSGFCHPDPSYFLPASCHPHKIVGLI